MAKNKDHLPDEPIYWTHDGKEIKITAMATPHIANAIRTLEKRLEDLREELRRRQLIEKFR